MTDAAKRANSPDRWDEIWSTSEGTDWREHVLAPVYARILDVLDGVGPGQRGVIDLGGGVGMLAKRLAVRGFDTEVWEHNEAALVACMENDIRARVVDLEGESIVEARAKNRIVVATEVLEHLSDAALERVLDFASCSNCPCFFSVPNDRLGPDEEEQHARKWTALAFKRLLLRYFAYARVEVLGQPATPKPGFPSDRNQPSFLLGVCNVPKLQAVSMCMPARDEEADVEKTLASFMGFVDEIVVGVDPRSKDRTRAIAEKYADVVFELEEVHGPPGDEVPEGGFHFAHARNQCMDRCTREWIFMTEAHEPLWKGHDVLLHLDEVPPDADVVHVMRTGGLPPNRQQWLFPWLCRSGRGFRYKRSTHNTLEYGSAPCVVVPAIKTLHARVHARDVARQAQRSVQNRQKLSDDWLATHNEWSLHYLGAEWREHDREKAIAYLHRYIELGTSGALRYHTRLVLAKELVRAGRPREAKDVLLDAVADDWTRNEHWVFLGDLAFDDGQLEEAVTYWEYAATKRGTPLSTWWIDCAMGSWIPQQRLAMGYSALGKLDPALRHARQVLLDYDEAEAPEAFVREAETNIQLLEEAIHERDSRDQPAAAE